MKKLILLTLLFSLNPLFAQKMEVKYGMLFYNNKITTPINAAIKSKNVSPEAYRYFRDAVVNRLVNCLILGYGGYELDRGKKMADLTQHHHHIDHIPLGITLVSIVPGRESLRRINIYKGVRAYNEAILKKEIEESKKTLN